MGTLGIVVALSHSSSSAETHRLTSERLPSLDVRDAPFHARCDWNGESGTDDTAAFQAAAVAATSLYRRTGRPVQVHLGNSCEVGDTVSFGSGVHWIGPGALYVPHQTRQVLRAQNADDVEVDGITIEVLTQDCGTNNATCSAISWESTEKDSAAHHKVLIRNNVVHHANWGILISYSAGRGSLSDVTISQNAISSPQAYMDADAIHVGGRVHHFEIRDNRIFNRGDAGIAASSEVPDYICADGTIENNVLLEDAVGLDNSGCTETVWRGNLVRATQRASGSNPASRVITYLGLSSRKVTLQGNYLQNGAGFGEFAAKVDRGTSREPSEVSLLGNTINSPLALYLRGAQIKVAGNTFVADGSLLTIDFEGVHAIPTEQIDVGRNTWLGAGEVRTGSNPSLLSRLNLARQTSATPLRYVNRGAFSTTKSESGTGCAEGCGLHGSSPHLAQQQLTRGSCVTTAASVPGAATDRNAHLTNAQVLSPQVLAWAYVSSPNSVTIRACALQATLFPAVSLDVAVE